MNTGYAPVTYLLESVSVKESSVSSKFDLDDTLRSACDKCIEQTFTNVVGSVFAFI